MLSLYAPSLGHWQPQGPLYDNLSLIPRLKIPLLLIHGGRDEVIPEAIGPQTLRRRPRIQRTLILPGAHHNDVYNLGGDAYVSRWRGFIHQIW